MIKHLPMKAEKAVIYLANDAGVFDVMYCPDRVQLAADIVKAANHHDKLLGYAKNLKAIWEETLPHSVFLENPNKLLKELE